eukprot:TRINITY_DN7098_c2_g1_i1.p1 TRINITY_DN7098_c2_g1~~TRINITY_DN7098_c2_g1_i1.p1  ORF type:complete len:1583 (+),score=392.58 TRINITY_DN7098_c2_g1_i1:49-4797(+)
MDPNEHLNALSRTSDLNIIMETLEQLSNLLCFGIEEVIRAFDVKMGMRVLLEVSKKSGDNEIVGVMAYRCMALALEYVPRSSEVLVAISGVPQLVGALKKCYDVDKMEELLKILKYISIDDSTGALLQNSVVPATISSMERQDRRLHPTSISILENIILKINMDPSASKPRAKKVLKFSYGSSTSPGKMIDTIRKEILPSLQGLLATLSIKDLDQGGSKSVAVAACCCLCTLVERCHRSVPDIMKYIAEQGFIQHFTELLEKATAQSDERQQSTLLKTLGVLCSIGPAVVTPILHNDPLLPKTLMEILVPEQQDFSSILKDPFGLQKEIERASGSGTKSTLDLRSDILYLVYCMTSVLPSTVLCSQVPKVIRIHQWEWEDDFHALNPYETSTQRLLEKGFQDGVSQQPITAKSSGYNVDMNVMKQTNPGTGVARNVKRQALPTGYQRLEEIVKEPTIPSPSKKSRKSSDKSEPPVIKAAVLHPNSIYSSDKGPALAKKLFSTMAAPLSLFAIQSSDTSTREWATETLARCVYTVVAAVQVKGAGWAYLSDELQQSAAVLTSSLITLLGKGASEIVLLDHALLTVELLAAVGGSATILQQLKKGGLQESLSTIMANSKALPQKLTKRVTGLVDTYLSSTAPQESGKKLKALTAKISKGSPGALTEVLNVMQDISRDVCLTELSNSGLAVALLHWFECDDANIRHTRYTEFMAALKANPNGAATLAMLLRQSVVSIETLPLSAPLEKADHTIKKQKTTGNIPRLDAVDFLRSIGRKGFKVRLSPSPVKEAEKVITVDPLATMGCLESFVASVTAAGGVMPASNGMRILTGSSARTMLEGLAAVEGADSTVLEILRGMNEDTFMMEDDEEDEGSSESVVFVDGSRASLYDEARAPKEASADLSPPVVHTFYLNGRPLPKTATMMDVMRQHCFKTCEVGLMQLERMFGQGGTSPQESLEKVNKKIAALKAKLTKLQSKKDDKKKKKSPSPEDMQAITDCKQRLEVLVTKQDALKKGIESFSDIWEVVVDLKWDTTARLKEPGARPEVFLSNQEALFWKIDKIIKDSAGLAASVRDQELFALLQVLKVLHIASETVIPLPPKFLECPHLTAKLMQALAANAVKIAVFGEHGAPDWCSTLPAACGFLFPLGARKEFTSFMTSNAMKHFIKCVKMRNRIPNADVIQPEMLPSQGTPMSIDREKLLNNANNLLSATTWRRFPLEIQYEGEEGTGLGPTLEFFTVVSKDLQQDSFKMWKGDVVKEHVMPPEVGCFPSPSPMEAGPSDMGRFQLLGRLAARAVLDGRLLDIPISSTLLRVARLFTSHPAPVCVTLQDVVDIDPLVGKSLLFLSDFSTSYDAEPHPEKKRKLAEEASLLPGSDGYYYFTLPGRDDIQLKPDGENSPVNCDNVRTFLHLAIEQMLFGAVKDRVGAFVLGFEEVLPVSVLHAYSDVELSEMMCGLAVNPHDALWTKEELTATIIADHGYSSDSRCIKHLISILCDDFSPREQREFLNWATGCPRLPVGGISALGKITVVRKTSGKDGKEEDDSMYLPSCNTCFRYLKLPIYPTKEVLSDKLRQAIRLGSGSFSLS